MNKRIALIFPGQGSQVVGMGKAFWEIEQDVRDVFALASDITGIDIARLCFDGPMEELTITSNLQPCLTAVEIGCALVLRNTGIQARAIAGHSLGEYPALWAAGVVSLEDVFRMVRKRGELMDAIGGKRPGAMAAVLGMERQALENALAFIMKKGGLWLANHNSLEQIVITGEAGPVADAVELLKARKVKAIPLKVAGAYHSPLMQEAAGQFADFINEITFTAPVSAFYSNVTASVETDPVIIKKLMIEQIVSPVRWYEIVTAMNRDGIDLFVEAGPKTVLSGLVRKCFRDISLAVAQVEDPAGVVRLKELLAN